MNTPMMMIAEIPVLDWAGPQFLMFYIAAFTVACLISAGAWAGWRRRLEPETTGAVPEDTHEIAWLAGGGPRVAQVAVARLLKEGLVSWHPQFMGADRLVRTQKPAPPALPPIEASLLEAVQGRRRGLPVSQVIGICSPYFSSLEARVAAMGLRPTFRERRAAVRSAFWPFAVLVLLGIVKLCLGILRDKPVGYLVALIFLSGVVALVINARLARVGRLTRAGDAVLQGLRTGHATRCREAGWEPDIGLWSVGIALAGASAITGIPDAGEIALRMQSQMAGGAGSGGSGSPSGCGSACGSSGGSSDGGSSGCGSSGCGGCGGGGD